MPDLSTITPVTREEEFLDRIARAAASPNLPEVDASDNGDVLTVVSGEWAAAAPASELPAVSGTDEGKVLTVVDNSGSYEWAAAEPGGGAGALIVEVSSNTLSKTAAEIIDALPLVFIYSPGSDTGLQSFDYIGMTSYLISDGTAQDLPPIAGYYFPVITGGQTTMFYAATLNDYPATH